MLVVGQAHPQIGQAQRVEQPLADVVAEVAPRPGADHLGQQPVRRRGVVLEAAAGRPVEPPARDPLQPQRAILPQPRVHRRPREAAHVQHHLPDRDRVLALPGELPARRRPRAPRSTAGRPRSGRARPPRPRPWSRSRCRTAFRRPPPARRRPGRRDRSSRSRRSCPAARPPPARRAAPPRPPATPRRRTAPAGDRGRPPPRRGRMRSRWAGPSPCRLSRYAGRSVVRSSIA